MKKDHRRIIGAGLIIGIIAAMLVFFGNPKNMGFCIACFMRDIAGAVGLHSAGAVQYIRPEIGGLILGAFIMALINKEFSAKGGSSPITRFFLGAFVMIGALVFLGCPFRTILRLAGGDLNAIFGLLGYVAGILVGVFFLKRGYSLKRTYKLPQTEGSIIILVAVAITALALILPEFIRLTEAGGGPGAMHAPLLLSLAAGLVVGGLAQRTRMCMVGGIRDTALFGDKKLLWGFVAIFVGTLVTNLILTGVTEGTYFTLSFADQPVAHTDGLWNFLGMVLAGFASALLGGCPTRQLILSAEGNSDSAITILGLFAGAAFAHNFQLASSGAGPTPGGKVAVIIGLIFALGIAYYNTYYDKSKRGIS